MLLSMTGFGRANLTFDKKEILCEVKAINSKIVDIRMKTPQRFSGMEHKIRKTISSSVQRGKVDLLIHVDSGEEGDDFEINSSLFKYYYTGIKDILNELGAQDDQMVNGILRIQNVIKSNMAEISDEEQSEVNQCLEAALSNLQKSRQTEGSSIAKDMSQRIAKISALLEQTQPFEAERMTKLRERLEKKLTDLKSDPDVDKNRFEQELIYYMEKLDISEEKQRLAQHCTYFNEVMTNAVTAKGKTLNFISQEIGREINTLGSKANNHEIQHIVVKMKDELEKIKEQLANVV